MSSSDHTAAAGQGRGFLRRIARWRQDQRGTTAIEFGMVGLPFLLFAMSVTGLGLYWLTTSQLNHAVSTASRQIRTGAAQRENKTVAEFKQMVCDNLTTMVSCDEKIQVHVQSFDQWADVQPISCIADGGVGLRQTGGNSTDSLTLSSGEASEVVMVTVCHEWELAEHMPWLLLAAKNGGTPQLGGAALIQASTIFRTEPYK
jgi:Flp pilus assembly protein TadG